MAVYRQSYDPSWDHEVENMDVWIHTCGHLWLDGSMADHIHECDEVFSHGPDPHHCLCGADLEEGTV